MSDITTNRIDTLTAEIVILKNQTAQNFVEIGKRLIEVKNSLPHGEFGKYLQSKVDFSWEWANELMTIAREFPNYNSSWNLTVKKLYLTTKLPAEEREAFVKDNDIENKSVRETERLIKEAKEKDQYIDVLINENNQLKNQKPETIIKEKIIEVVPQTTQNYINNLKKSLANSEKEFAIAQEKLRVLDHLKDKKEEIEKAHLEYNTLKVKINSFNKAIEDMKIVIAFNEKFDKFFHNEMMPLATIVKPENVNRNIREELFLRVENVNNWLYAINQKFNKG